MDNKYDLNAPAFGDGAQKIGEPIAEAEADPIVEVANEEVQETSEEESKVPYSRFKKFHDEALQLRQEAAEWRAKAEAVYSEPRSSNTDTSDVPANWIKLYGDSDASLEAWQIQKQENERIKDEARQAAIEAVQNEKYQETRQIQENLSILDDDFETLSAFVGRNLTEKEQSNILDIRDEYTPKDDDGNYTGPLLPVEKAWEIYELKQQATKAPNQKSRDSVASLIGNQSKGETSVSDRDKNFNPLDWNSWRNRI